MQNSLDRLFEGIVRALREDVAPHLADPYARAQAVAAADLAANLATRVQWDRDYLTASTVDARALLQAAVLQAGPGSLPCVEAVLESDEDAGETEATAIAHLEAISQAQAWAASQPAQVAALAAGLREIADRLLEDELERLRRV